MVNLDKIIKFKEALINNTNNSSIEDLLLNYDKFADIISEYEDQILGENLKFIEQLKQKLVKAKIFEIKFNNIKNNLAEKIQDNLSLERILLLHDTSM